MKTIRHALVLALICAASPAWSGMEPEVNLSIDDASADEAGQDPATFSVTRTNAGNVAQALTVNYQLGGSAVLGSDFNPDVFIFGGQVGIPGGELSVTVNLTPILDNLREAQENITLELLAGNNYTLGMATTGEMTIEDDPAEVNLSIDDASAAEAGQDPATFSITRTDAGNVAQALTVNYQLGGSAVLGSDFNPDVFIFGGQVGIPAGELSVTVNLTPIPDSASEGQENITIELLTGNSYTLGTTISGEMTIEDDAPEVSLSIDDDHADEAGQDPATFTVTRTNAGNVGQVLAVNYQLGGSATLGSDFNADVFIGGGQVSIPAGELSVTVNLIPVDDGPENEGDETIEMTLLAGSNYTLGTPSSGTMTLADALEFLFADGFESSDPMVGKCSLIQLASDRPGRFFDQGAFVTDLETGLVWNTCGLRSVRDRLVGTCLAHTAWKGMTAAEQIDAFNAGLIGDGGGFTDWRFPSSVQTGTLPTGCQGLLVRED